MIPAAAANWLEPDQTRPVLQTFNVFFLFPIFNELSFKKRRKNPLSFQEKLFPFFFKTSVSHPMKAHGMRKKTERGEGGNEKCYQLLNSLECLFLKSRQQLQDVCFLVLKMLRLYFTICLQMHIL